MKLLFLFIFVLVTFTALGQDKQNSKTPVQILYGPAEPTGKGRGPLSAGVLNMKAILERLPIYPEKAKDGHIEGRVEIQVLVNEDGEVIFANPLSGPEALWAESVKAAVAARFQPSSVKGEPVKVSGRLIFDFKKGKVELPYKNGFTG